MSSKARFQSPLMKFEKDNENKNIRRKFKAVQPRAQAGIVFDKNAQQQFSKNTQKAVINSRLNPSLENGPSMRKRTPMSPRHAFVETTESYVRKLHIFPNHKPLEPYMTSTVLHKPRGGNKKSSQKIVIVQPSSEENERYDDDNEKSSHVIRELLTPRNTYSAASSRSSTLLDLSGLSPSLVNHAQDAIPETADGTSMAEFDSSRSSTVLDLDLDLQSLHSPGIRSDIFQVAPLISIPSAAVSSTSSAIIVNKLRDELDRERNTMADEEITVIKKVLKTDERHILLKDQDTDPKLFKEILRTQLNEIVRHERIVKRALQKLGIPVPATTETAKLTSKCYATPRGLRKKPNLYFDSRFDDSQRYVKTMREVAIDTQSLAPNQSVSQRKTNDYEEKGEQEILKNEKRTAKAGKEFEEFVKSTLPIKIKATSDRQSPRVGAAVQQQCGLASSHVRQALEEQTEQLQPKSSRLPQVEVTFKNVPPETEFMLLKTLGERLEDENVKCTATSSDSSENNGNQLFLALTSNASLTTEIHKVDPSIKVFPGRNNKQQKTTVTRTKAKLRAFHCIMCEQFCVYSVAHSQGLRHEWGSVREFVIVPKTLDELKSDANSNFYMPKDKDGNVLECTSFQKLTQHPEWLLRHLKPKNTGVPFNVLDHDPMFFSSFLLPNFKSNVSVKEVSAVEVPSKPVILCEGGDSTTKAALILRESVKKSEEPKQAVVDQIYEQTDEQPKQLETEIDKSQKLSKIEQMKTEIDKNQKLSKMEQMETEIDKSPKLSKISIQQKPRKHKNIVKATPASSKLDVPQSHARRLRRNVTPMPLNSYDDSKNQLFRTLLVGTVQISVFLIMIVAIMYPDIKC